MPKSYSKMELDIFSICNFSGVNTSRTFQTSCNIHFESTTSFEPVRSLRSSRVSSTSKIDGGTKTCKTCSLFFEGTKFRHLAITEVGAGLVSQKAPSRTKCACDNATTVLLPKLYKMGRRRESLLEYFFAQGHLNPVLIHTETLSVKEKEITTVFYFMLTFKLQSLLIITRGKESKLGYM